MPQVNFIIFIFNNYFLSRLQKFYQSKCVSDSHHKLNSPFSPSLPTFSFVPHAVTVSAAQSFIALMLDQLLVAFGAIGILALWALSVPLNALSPRKPLSAFIEGAAVCELWVLSTFALKLAAASALAASCWLTPALFFLARDAAAVAFVALGSHKLAVAAAKRAAAAPKGCPIAATGRALGLFAAGWVTVETGMSYVRVLLPAALAPAAPAHPLLSALTAAGVSAGSGAGLSALASTAVLGFDTVPLLSQRDLFAAAALAALRVMYIGCLAYAAYLFCPCPPPRANAASSASAAASSSCSHESVPAFARAGRVARLLLAHELLRAAASAAALAAMPGAASAVVDGISTNAALARWLPLLPGGLTSLVLLQTVVATAAVATYTAFYGEKAAAKTKRE